MALRGRRTIVIASLAGLLAVAVLFALSSGPANIPYAATAAILLDHAGLRLDAPYSETDRRIVELIRAPRVVAALLVGGALAVAGVVTQAAFRNPLADPGLIGISGGAAAGAVLAIGLQLPAIHPLLLPAAAFTGAIGATALIVGIGTARGASGAVSLLLAGVAVSSFFGATTSAILAATENRDLLREMIFWLLGGLDNRAWTHVGLIAAPVVLGAALIAAHARELNLLVLGDDGARALGVRPGRTRLLLLGLAALVAAAAVSISGTIAFVGLVVPHLLRTLVGPDHRVLIPVSVLGGALFLLLADTVARLVLQPTELRVGMVAAFVGAPFFLFVLLTDHRTRTQ
ncbi:MAG: iron ABC transporter permease [Chloroflexi bacterium]|nr:iron ABC transporter permease [Chloroflexota bacterium]